MIGRRRCWHALAQLTPARRKLSRSHGRDNNGQLVKGIHGDHRLELAPEAAGPPRRAIVETAEDHNGHLGLGDERTDALQPLIVGGAVLPQDVLARGTRKRQ